MKRQRWKFVTPHRSRVLSPKKGRGVGVVIDRAFCCLAKAGGRPIQYADTRAKHLLRRAHNRHRMRRSRRETRNQSDLPA